MTMRSLPERRTAARRRRGLFRPGCVTRVALGMTWGLVFLVPASDEIPSHLREEAEEAQSMIESLQRDLGIGPEVLISMVAYHPFVFAVEPVSRDRTTFRLYMEAGFAIQLSRAELRAALAHELGHVWIFTHHPYLQTEHLANQIALQVVPRRDLEQLYAKLWAYEGKPGMDMDGLLGPARPVTPDRGVSGGHLE